jgi:general secretion pathway protein B
MPQQTSGDRAPVEPQPVAHNETPIKNKIYSVRELPASLQQNLPDFSISTHLYSGDTTSRMIRVNGQMLREGQILSDGLKLEEIDQNSLILSYQNFRFRVGLK